MRVISSVPIPKFASFHGAFVCEPWNRRTLADYGFWCGFGSEVRMKTRGRDDADFRTATLAQLQLAQNIVDDGFDRRIDRNLYRMLIRRRRLQGLELTRQQSRRHEMALAQPEAVRNQFLRTVKVDELDVMSAVHQDIAIDPPQRRAAHHHVLAVGRGAVDLGSDRAQPGPAVLIGQGLARAHLGDVAGGMKSVGVLVAPANAICELLANRGFA